MEELSTTPVQGDRISGLQSKGRVVGLDAVAPDAAVGAVHQLGMGVDRQEQAAAAAQTAPCGHVVIRERSVPVADQQAVLVGEVLDPVVQDRIAAPTEVVGVGQPCVEAPVLAELGHVGVEVEGGLGAGGAAESRQRSSLYLLLRRPAGSR